jgi:hypothetical protein
MLTLSHFSYEFSIYLVNVDCFAISCKLNIAVHTMQLNIFSIQFGPSDVNSLPHYMFRLPSKVHGQMVRHWVLESICNLHASVNRFRKPINFESYVTYCCTCVNVSRNEYNSN